MAEKYIEATVIFRVTPEIASDNEKFFSDLDEDVFHDEFRDYIDEQLEDLFTSSDGRTWDATIWQCDIEVREMP